MLSKVFVVKEKSRAMGIRADEPGSEHLIHLLLAKVYLVVKLKSVMPTMPIGGLLLT